MITIVINEETSTNSEMSNVLRHIAKLIDDGYTSGVYPTWSITDETERNRKIEFIKDTLDTYGETSTKDLELEKSPIFKTVDENNVFLIERFTQDDVTVVEYINNVYVDEHEVSYDDLNDEQIDDVYEVITQYHLTQKKLYDSIRNEDY